MVPVIEFPLFPADSFYEIDVTESTITMAVKTNKEAYVTVFPESVADKDHFDLGAEITSVDLVGMAELNQNATVSLIDPKIEICISDSHNTSILLPFTVENGGVLVEIGPGSNISTTGVKLMLEYTQKGDGEDPGGDSGVPTCNFPTLLISAASLIVLTLTIA